MVAASNGSARKTSISAAKPPAKVGDKLEDIDTPALLVDLEAFDRNVLKLKAAVESHTGVRVRPHAKAHKVPEIARRQKELLGPLFCGVCCQKVSELEAMAEGGVPSVLVSNEIVALPKIRRLLDVAASGTEVMVCVDNPRNLEDLSREAAARGQELPVLVEFNVGGNRCGVDSIEEVVALAQAAGELPGVTFRGIQAYNGHAQHKRTPEERAGASTAVVAKAHEIRDALAAQGIACPIVTGAGSGTYRSEAGSGLYNELQPGTFAFGDADYGRNLQPDGSKGEWEQALWVLGQVVSRSAARHSVVLDAGSKAVSYDSGPPVVPAAATGGVQTQAVLGGDEHTVVVWPEGSEAVLPELGALLKMQPGHCDPTCNLHDWMVAVRGDRVEAVWCVRARGPGS